ncbi:hypothetical protein SD457_07155 [Coprobacillaceae bacterium CR2/5/TPMF4]|nr:hypothetical protein SD457_07155 [Coprobacillaceae bacterium CR2/5/TPMF4]
MKTLKKFLKSLFKTIRLVIVMLIVSIVLVEAFHWISTESVWAIIIVSLIIIALLDMEDDDEENEKINLEEFLINFIIALFFVGSMVFVAAIIGIFALAV